MKNQLVFLSIAILVLVFAVACGASPTAVPQPTQPPQVVTVVITATPPPATATPAQPTLTPVPTVAITATVAGPTSAPTKAAVATKPPVVASRTPTKPAVAPTATALPIKYAAPNLLYPLWQPSFNTSQQDEVRYPGSAMVLKWKSVGALYDPECYRIDLLSEPINAPVSPQSDYFVKCTGNDVGLDADVTYTLNRPNQPGPNYSSLILNNASDMWVTWTVTVVRNLGSCTEAFHCKTAPLSPPSTKGKFLLKGS
jgi:hypothetical protein